MKGQWIHEATSSPTPPCHFLLQEEQVAVLLPAALKPVARPALHVPERSPASPLVCLLALFENPFLMSPPEESVLSPQVE